MMISGRSPSYFSITGKINDFTVRGYIHNAILVFWSNVSIMNKFFEDKRINGFDFRFCCRLFDFDFRIGHFPKKGKHPIHILFHFSLDIPKLKWGYKFHRYSLFEGIEYHENYEEH